MASGTASGIAMALQTGKHSIAAMCRARCGPSVHSSAVSASRHGGCCRLPVCPNPASRSQRRRNADRTVAVTRPWSAGRCALPLTRHRNKWRLTHIQSEKATPMPQCVRSAEQSPCCDHCSRWPNGSQRRACRVRLGCACSCNSSHSHVCTWKQRMAWRGSLCLAACWSSSVDAALPMPL